MIDLKRPAGQSSLKHATPLVFLTAMVLICSLHGAGAAPALDAFTRAFQLELSERYSEAVAAYQEALEEDPASSYLATRRAFCLLRAGRTTEAAEAAQRVTAVDSTAAEAHWIAGMSLARDGELQAALPRLRAAARLEPDTEAYPSGLIRVLGALGRSDEAPQELEAVLGGEAESARWLHRLGLLLLRQNQPRAALRMFRQVVERDPQDARAWLVIGDLQAEAGRVDEALSAYRQVLEIQPRNMRAPRRLLPLLVRREEWSAAREIFAGILGEEPDPVRNALQLSRWLVRQERSEDAVSLIDAALEEHPREENLLRARLRLSVENLSPRRVLDAAEALLAVDPENLEALRLRAAATADMGRVADALELLNRMRSLAPDDVPSRLLTGQLHASRGDWERASEIYGEILAADSTETRALFQLGVALERQGRFEESLDVFRRLVKL
ncbi:MAG: tetratricopeptide repeat protein, partial [Candidatus Eisenbacteria bacterium]|nr:tetratricopeptide repeat protein [Candidatus Eisenbacteria bacterium]